MALASSAHYNGDYSIVYTCPRQFALSRNIESEVVSIVHEPHTYKGAELSKHRAEKTVRVVEENCCIQTYTSSEDDMSWMRSHPHMHVCTPNKLMIMVIQESSLNCGAPGCWQN